MKILDDIKLDFSDVLLVPKRSEYSSRSEVSLNREIKFKYSPYVWSGVPIMVSNMDTTGTIEMALELQKHKVITCLHKHYKWDEISKECYISGIFCYFFELTRNSVYFQQCPYKFSQKKFLFIA